MSFLGFIKDFTSDDGVHLVTLDKTIQDFWAKDEQESVGVFEGTYKGKEVIVKVFLLRYVLCSS